MKACAYCKENKKTTREHIIPKFLYKYQKENGGHVGWNEKAGKIVESEAKIRDTCDKCNNELLGDLDRQAQATLRQSGVFTSNFLRSSAVLHYDYDFFARWLMKVTFNSARANDSNPQVYERHIPYILGQKSENSDIYILAAIHKPVKLSQKEMVKYENQLPFDSNGYSNPFFVRICKVPKVDSDYDIRGFVIGSFLFCIVIFNEGILSGYKKVKIRKLLKGNKGMKLLDKKTKAKKILQTNVNFLDTQKEQLNRLTNLGVL